MKPHGKASLLVIGCALVASLSAAAAAKILTWDDVVGKKSCWDGPLGPSTSTYSPGGQTLGKTWDSMVGSGTITEIKAEGWHVVTDKGDIDEKIELLPDGTLKDIAVFRGKTYEDIGNYCE